MDKLLQIFGLQRSPIIEGNSIFSYSKKKKKKTTDTCPEPNTDQIDAVYQSQLDNYSTTITELNGNVTDLSSKLYQSEFNYNNAESSCNAKLAEQKDNYENQLNNQKKSYDSQIADLTNKLNSALNTIDKDNNIIKNDTETIKILREELQLAKMNRDKCIKEAIAAGKRFGFKNATIEGNVYRAELNGLFNDIKQELSTMQTQNLYAYTLKDHIQNVKKNLQIVNKQIEDYVDNINLNKRKAYYEQEEINMEQGWEIGLHILYASIFLGTIVFLAIHVDKNTNAPKIMNPQNIALLVFLLLYPMIIYPITKYVYQMIQYGIKNLPKDMYMKL